MHFYLFYFLRKYSKRLHTFTVHCNRFLFIYFYVFYCIFFCSNIFYMICYGDTKTPAQNVLPNLNEKITLSPPFLFLLHLKIISKYLVNILKKKQP